MSLITVDTAKSVQIGREKVALNRQRAYAKEADPIGLQVLRGEATEAEWLQKIAEIKSRYPYATE